MIERTSMLPKSKHSNSTNFDLKDRKTSLTSYIIDNGETLKTLKTNDELINFIKQAPDEGYVVSEQAIDKIVRRIKVIPFIKAQKYVYELMLAGRNLRVNRYF